jgi:ABC-2 type transport system ATP-binding protein
MHILSVRDVVKKYSNHTAVDHINLDIPKGIIFGLLGPNGAGKTSLIRMITSITQPDQGQIFIDGEQLHGLHPNQIGYMPEERGLYKKMKVGEQLIYLARLKGLDPKQAKKALNHWLEKFEITSWWDKKIEELSKGMQQKVQFIATVVHDPKLIILDEPFSGLDPINTNLIKDEIHALNANGASVIFSTHRMEQVEQICEEIALVNKGKIVLKGNVEQIKADHKENKFLVEFDGSLPAEMLSDAFQVIEDSDKGLVIKVMEGHHSNELLKGLIDRNIEIKRYQEILPTLNNIFIQKVGESNE